MAVGAALGAVARPLVVAAGAEAGIHAVRAVIDAEQVGVGLGRVEQVADVELARREGVRQRAVFLPAGGAHDVH